MQDVLQRLMQNLVDRVHGPMTFRFLLQPTMAILYALWDGWKDARAGKPPYFWALFSDVGHRREILREGWKSIGKVVILALILDAVYQWFVLHWIYPGEMLLLAILLAIVPYLAVRGPVNRLLRRKFTHS